MYRYEGLGSLSKDYLPKFTHNLKRSAAMSYPFPFPKNSMIAEVLHLTNAFSFSYNCSKILKEGKSLAALRKTMQRNAYWVKTTQLRSWENTLAATQSQAFQLFPLTFCYYLLSLYTQLDGPVEGCFQLVMQY